MSKTARKWPRAPRELTASPAALAEVCAHLGAAAAFGFDMEWDPRPSYRPRLCLVQVATDERVELIDPTVLEHLGPFWDLLADPTVEKICHAGGQDLAIAWRLGRQRPQHVFDGQIGAGLLGLGHQEGYPRLVEIVTGIEVAKKQQRSDWSRRPLQPAQLTYAANDVQYLPEIHRVLRERLEALGRMPWLRAACEQLCERATTDVARHQVFADIPGASRLPRRAQAVLRELAALREELAHDSDSPVQWLLDDKALVSLAGRGAAADPGQAALSSVPRPVAKSHGEQLLHAIRRGRELPPEEWPHLPPPREDTPETKQLAEIMYAASQVICLGQLVAPGMVTNKKEIEGLARLLTQGGDVAEHPLMNGWTRECLGAALVGLVRGETTVSLHMTPDRMHAEFQPRV